MTWTRRRGIVWGMNASVWAALGGALALLGCGGDSDDSSGTGGSGGTGASAGVGGTGGSGAGGSCTYRDLDGTAEITLVEPAAEGCGSSPQTVRYTFTPDDMSIPPEDYDPANFGFNASFETIVLENGKNPPESCLAAAGLVTGAQFEMVRSVIETGGCTPVIDTVQIDLTACDADC